MTEPQDTVFIGDLDKAAVLAALYNTARAQGMGFLQYNPAPMTTEQARDILDAARSDDSLRGPDRLYFDYLFGRVLKVDMTNDTFFPRLYDRDNGAGAAQNVVSLVRTTGRTNTEWMQATHQMNTDLAMAELLGIMPAEKDA